MRTNCDLIGKGSVLLDVRFELRLVFCFFFCFEVSAFFELVCYISARIGSPVRGDSVLKRTIGMKKLLKGESGGI